MVERGREEEKKKKKKRVCEKARNEERYSLTMEAGTTHGRGDWRETKKKKKKVNAVQQKVTSTQSDSAEPRERTEALRGTGTPRAANKAPM